MVAGNECIRGNVVIILIGSIFKLKRKLQLCCIGDSINYIIFSESKHASHYKSSTNNLDKKDERKNKKSPKDVKQICQAVIQN